MPLDIAYLSLLPDPPELVALRDEYAARTAAALMSIIENAGNADARVKAAKELNQMLNIGSEASAIRAVASGMRLTSLPPPPPAPAGLLSRFTPSNDEDETLDALQYSLPD